MVGQYLQIFLFLLNKVNTAHQNPFSSTCTDEWKCKVNNLCPALGDQYNGCITSSNCSQRLWLIVTRLANRCFLWSSVAARSFHLQCSSPCLTPGFIITGIIIEKKNLKLGPWPQELQRRCCSRTIRRIPRRVSKLTCVCDSWKTAKGCMW